MQERIIDDLRRLELREGDCVMMHSSLSALGYVEGGPDAVVDALTEVLGNDGTLLVPGFRDSCWDDEADFAITDSCPCPQRLCPSKQRGFQGIIAETIRNRPDSLRSCHPTHSWVALGPASKRLLSGHRDSPTPCGCGNPFEALVELDGCLLTLGVVVNTITSWHYYEDILEVPYLGHYWPSVRHLNYCVSGHRIQYMFPGIMQELCQASGILKAGPVGKSTSGLMRAREFDSFMATAMADDPYCFVLRPPDRKSGDLLIDALKKAEAMLRAWRSGPGEPPKSFGIPLHPISLPQEGDTVREDCPAFAGYHDADGNSIPMCRANAHHPDIFRLGGIFNDSGVTTCGLCRWNEKFPPI